MNDQLIDLKIMRKDHRAVVILNNIIKPALRLMNVEFGFPGNPDDPNTHRMLVAISAQEADLQYRAQLDAQGRENPNGPALGLLQFEKGTYTSLGGVSGVIMHYKSAPFLKRACVYFHLPFTNEAIWRAQRTNDQFAFITGRLLLWTDPYAMPKEQKVGWVAYADRLWRPGKPHPERWAANWQLATDLIEGRLT